MTRINLSKCGDFLVGWGKRLKWPDDYFTLFLQNWLTNATI